MWEEKLLDNKLKELKKKLLEAFQNMTQAEEDYDTTLRHLNLADDQKEEAYQKWCGAKITQNELRKVLKAHNLIRNKELSIWNKLQTATDIYNNVKSELEKEVI